MKKLMSILVLSLICSGAFAADHYYGGFSYFGAHVLFNPQKALHDELAKGGYAGFSDTDYGMLWGGGGILNNFYVGGWGFFNLSGQSVANDAAQLTLTKTSSGEGGMEVGYTILNSKNFHLIPSLSMMWGGNTYTLATNNVSFSDYVSHLTKGTSSFSVGNLSLGIGITLMGGGSQYGLVLKAVYIYNFASSLGPISFASAPAINPHSFMLSLSTYIGKVSTKKDFHYKEEKNQSATK